MASWYYLNRALRNKSIVKNQFSIYENTILTENFKEAKVNLNPTCRICLQDGTVSIFDSVNTSDIVKMLMIFGGIEVTEQDSHPKFLCDTCYSFICIAHNFRRTAKRSDDIFKQSPKEEVVLHSEDSIEDYDYSTDDYKTEQDQHSDNWNSLDTNDCKFKKEQKEIIKISAKVTCHICNKLINKSYIKEHITMHDPDHKKYVCDVCGKSFRLRCAYHNHSLRHRTDFPYKCTFCPYRGRYAELLKNHMRTHTGDYRYMCTECPARFLFKSNLNSHMHKHKEPQFKCDTCKRAFHTSLALQRHYEADHLGIKNHVCNVCGKAFGYRNAMMKHQRHVHKREKLLFGRMPAYLQAENKKQNVSQ